jgi:hypothetical protein
MRCFRRPNRRHVLIGLFGGEAESHLFVRVEKNAHAGLARPGEARHVIDVYDLRVEQIARQSAERPLRFGVSRLQLWPARNSILPLRTSTQNRRRRGTNAPFETASRSIRWFR